jgi:hypothetical protein
MSFRIGQRIGMWNGCNARIIKKDGRHVLVRVPGDSYEKQYLYHEDERAHQQPWARRSQTYVCVYEVTRHYGGPEEGGWWYNWYEPVYAIRVPTRFSMRHRDRLARRFQKQSQGDIYSVLGGVDYVVRRSGAKFQHATTRRPHYE